MGLDRIENAGRPFCTVRRAAALAGASILLLLLGFAVREAEFNQVGSSNTASMWVFVASGLCLYAAAVMCWTVSRRRKKKRRRENLRPGHPAGAGS